MSDQAGDPRRFVAVEPRIDAVGVARLQEPGSGDPMGGLALGDLQDGPAALADIGAWVVIPKLD
jgi:hypothetical protein